VLDPTSEYANAKPSDGVPNPSRTVRFERGKLPYAARCNGEQPFATAETTRVEIDGIDCLVYIPTSYVHGSRKHSSPLLVGIAGRNAPCLDAINALFTPVVTAEYVLVAPCLHGTNYDAVSGAALGHNKSALLAIAHRLRNIVSTVKRGLCINQHRVFLAGFGSGGALAEMAASYLTDVVRAVASVGGVFPGATRSHPSLIHFHSTCDDVVPFFGSSGSPSVVEHMLKWAVHASCEQPPMSTFASGDHQNLVWKCADSVQLELIVSLGARHAWIKDNSLDTTDQIIGFFSGHSHEWGPDEN
jgi:hypothetical protein